MKTDLTRRRLLVSTSALAGVFSLGPWAGWSGAATVEAREDEETFRFEQLIERARRMSTRPYEPPAPRYEALLDDLGYEAFMGIHMREGAALWANDDTPVTIEFFPLDQNARDPVAIHVVENEHARRVTYRSDLFRYDDAELAKRLPNDLGFSGFRMVDRAGEQLEWFAFKGASYFRSPGALGQYGLSARGIAIDTGFGGDERFPRFSHYWLFKPESSDDTLTLCALLDGEKITGAYRMQISRPGDVLMHVEAHLFQRGDVQRLGVAPLTSMFWFSETNARRSVDWRPEIHDSDGLLMHTGAGETIWRALSNPPQAQYSAFADDNPRGFGLMQRDRAFDHYQDPAVGFERRPSLWVEPKNDWGLGHVGLLELRTDEEVYDNINAFWVPAADARAGREWRFDYRLRWCVASPHRPALARVTATRTGRAGGPGTYEEQPPLARKFVIDFEGEPLNALTAKAEPTPHVETSHGRISNPYVQHVPDTGRWRLFFDWKGEDPPAHTPVDLRAALSHADEVLTETWMYTYYPQPLPRRLVGEHDNT